MVGVHISAFAGTAAVVFASPKSERPILTRFHAGGHVLSRTIVLGLMAVAAHAQLDAKLSPETNKAFEQYVDAHAPGIIQQAKSDKPLPWLGDASVQKIRKGDVVVKGFTGDNGKPVQDGIVHDWLGGLFIPGTTIDKVLTVVQDFDRHAQWYPEIIESKRLGGNGDTTRGSWTMRKKKIITVVLRTELDSRLNSVNPKHAYLLSEANPVIEVKDYGKPGQTNYPKGEGHGFLWRFNGYWSFHEADGGVYVECRVISLSRDVPSGLGWIVNPFIRSMPRESLESTLKNTREAVGKL